MLVLASPVWILLLFYTPDFELGAGIVLLPTIAIVMAMLLRQLSGDKFERQALLVGLVFKLFAAGMYNAMVFFVYHGLVDSLTYYRTGVDWAANFGMVGTDAIRYPYWGTPFITTLSGALIYFVPSYAAVAGIFALVSYWGQYFLYKAFTIAFPEGDRFDMVLMALLLPSVSFWSATVGKESVILLGIGLCAYGYARASARANPGGYLISGVGLALAGLVRPHIAAMLALALAFAVSLSSTKRGVVGALNKIIGIPLIIAGTIYLVARAQTFVNAADFSTGVTSIQKIQHYSSAGGSSFSGSSTSRILFSPFLLFRPFPWEVNSALSVLASLEGLGFAIIFWRRRRSLWYAIFNWRNPFVTFILAFSLQFVVAFSAAISNFGILTRERVMLIPIAAMLLCLPPARRKMSSAHSDGRRTRLSWKTALPTAPVLSPTATGRVPPVPISRV